MLAHISDFGTENATETLVANLVYSWRPDAIFTSGDNSQGGLNYEDDVGADYGEFVDRKLLWPCPGNHDWEGGTIADYMDYFSDVVENRHYYKKVFGPLALFMLDSVAYTPDGYDTDSAQYDWLARELPASNAPWNIVSLHYPPYSSGATHGSIEDLQWGFGALGADMVFSGHDHIYERLYVDTYYIVAGMGGSSLYSFGDTVTGSQFRYNSLNGAGKLIATPNKLKWAFYSYDGALVDSLTLDK